MPAFKVFYGSYFKFIEISARKICLLTAAAPKLPKFQSSTENRLALGAYHRTVIAASELRS